MNKQTDFNSTQEFEMNATPVHDQTTLNDHTTTENKSDLEPEVIVPETTTAENIDSEVTTNQDNTVDMDPEVVETEVPVTDAPTATAESMVPNPFKALIIKLNTLVQGLTTKSDDYKTTLQQAECDKFTTELREFFSNFNHDYAQALATNQALDDATHANNNFEGFIAAFNKFLLTFNDVAEFNLASAGEGIVNLTIRRDHYQEQLTSAKAKHERLVIQQNTAKNYAAEKLVKNSLKPFFQNMDNALKHLRKEEDTEFKVFVAKLEAFQNDFFQQLQHNNLEVFGIAGEEFDPNFHNALSMVPAPSPEMHNKLAFVSSQGYKLHDRVVVPADVMVFFDPSQS